MENTEWGDQNRHPGRPAIIPEEVNDANKKVAEAMINTIEPPALIRCGVTRNSWPRSEKIDLTKDYPQFIIQQFEADNSDEEYLAQNGVQKIIDMKVPRSVRGFPFRLWAQAPFIGYRVGILCDKNRKVVSMKGIFGSLPDDLYQINKTVTNDTWAKYFGMYHGAPPLKNRTKVIQIVEWVTGNDILNEFGTRDISNIQNCIAHFMFVKKDGKNWRLGNLHLRPSRWMLLKHELTIWWKYRRGSKPPQKPLGLPPKLDEYLKDGKFSDYR